jgi:hypothetical protein
MTITIDGNLGISSNGVNYVTPNDSGYITQAGLPAFHYNTVSNVAQTSGSAIPIYLNAVTVSASYSTTTGRFTAPITGQYLFTWCYLCENIANGTQFDDGWNYNGSFRFGGERRVAAYGSTIWNDGVGYYPVKQAIMIRMNAGDYFHPQTQHTDTSWRFYQDASWGHFSGCLIG